MKKSYQIPSDLTRYGKEKSRQPFAQLQNWVNLQKERFKKLENSPISDYLKTVTQFSVSDVTPQFLPSKPL